MIEYRVGWSAMSNITFKGQTEWQEWAGFEDTVKDVEDAIDGGGPIGLGLEEVISASGLEWWAEVREVDASSQEDE